MPYDCYHVLLGSLIIAEGMSMEHALIFVKALCQEYYNEPNLKISIEREKLNDERPDFDDCNDIFSDDISNNRRDALREKLQQATERCFG